MCCRANLWTLRFLEFPADQRPNGQRIAWRLLSGLHSRARFVKFLDVKVHFLTFGCKANQYDTEKFRQELEARGATVVDTPEQADACVVNTCTVTNQADAEARKAIRKLRRAAPDIKIVVAGCSAALRPDDYLAMDEVYDVVRGHDPLEVATLLTPQDAEPIGAELLQRDERGTRGWLKIQDGCDRRCSFCATKIARGASRSRSIEEIVREAQVLAEHHRELVLTGIHIGHYGVDFDTPSALSELVARLIDEVPTVRFRLGSVEATEIDDRLVELLVDGTGLVPHLHVPMQSGSNSVLRRMRRWHTREQYRDRVLEIADALPILGLGADVIVGFPGETAHEHAQTRALVEELPFTYLHVFAYSVRDGTHAATLPDHVPGDIQAARSRELREIAQEKGERYQRTRAGQAAEIIVEAANWGVTEDYLRVRLVGDPARRLGETVYVPLQWSDDELIAVA